MNYYTYRIDFVDADYYYGRRQCECDPVDDKYYGSPVTHKDKWQTTEFKKTIINTYETLQEQVDAESELIGDKWKTDPKCLNNSAGGASYFHHKHTEETKSKIRAAKTGKPHPNHWTPDAKTKAKISKSLTGKKQSPELIEKRIAPLRGRCETWRKDGFIPGSGPYKKGKTTWNKGKKWKKLHKTDEYTLALLDALLEAGASIPKAAECAGVKYPVAWNRLKRLGLK
jgi:hypothetical protein